MSIDGYEHVRPAGDDHWPTYRVRRDVRAKRIGHPFIFEAQLYRDGYVVSDRGDGYRVLAVAEFETIYELAGLNG